MSDVTRIVLIASPLTGPRLWSGVCDALWARGRRAFVQRLTDTAYLFPPYWLTQAASAAAELPEEDAVVLVAHSGAGVLLPAIGRFGRNRQQGARIAGYVFVDCDLPRDGCSRLDLFDDEDAAAAFRDDAHDGFVPRWTSESLAALIPDRAAREAFVADLPRVSIDLYEELIRVPDEWPEAPCGYLRLSDAYPSAVARSAELGWRTRRLESHHFAPVSDPEAVADALVALIDEIVVATDGALPADR